MQAKTATGLACLITIGCLSTAQAQIFSCKDAAGKMIAADRQMPECSDRAVRVLSVNGVHKREIPAPLTAEQKQAKLQEEQKRKQDEAALAEQRQQDRAILLRYQNEHDIASAQKREIEQLKERIAADQEKIADAEKRRAMAQTEISRSPGKPAAALQSAIESSERVMRDSRKNIAAFETDIAAVHRKYDKTVQRFRQLNAGQGIADNTGGLVRTGVPAN